MTTIKIEVPDGEYCYKTGTHCRILRRFPHNTCTYFGDLEDHNGKWRDIRKHPDCKKAEVKP